MSKSSLQKRKKQTLSPSGSPDGARLPIQRFSPPPNDTLQQAIEKAFPVIGTQSMKLASAFALIPDSGVAEEFTRAGEAWRWLAAARLARALTIEFDYGNSSIQQRIVAHGGTDAASRFQIACLERDSALLRIAESILSGSSAIRSRRTISAGKKRTPRLGDAQTNLLSPSPAFAVHAREEAMLSMCCVFPERILHLASFIQVFAVRMRIGQGLALLERLHRSLAKFRRRSKREGPYNVDPILLTMAQHWTNPDYPLWLMREPAATKVLERVFSAKEVSANQFRQRRQDHFSSTLDYLLSDVLLRRTAAGSKNDFDGFKLRSDLQHLSGKAPVAG